LRKILPKGKYDDHEHDQDKKYDDDDHQDVLKKVAFSAGLGEISGAQTRS